MLGKLDTWLTEHPKRKDLHGWRRFIVESHAVFQAGNLG